MLDEAAVLAHFAGWDLNAEERRYLELHSRRLAYVLPIVADCVRARGGGAVDVVDIGPHLLTELLGRCFPQATLNTLGFRHPTCYREERVRKHFDFDLNDEQEPESRAALPEHDIVVMAEVIEHLYTAPELVLRFVRGLLKPGGFLVLQTPNAVAWDRRLGMLRGRNPFEPIRQSRQNPGHFREYTVDELKLLGEVSDLAVESSSLASYFNVRLNVPVRVLCRLRPSFRQGITVVYRRRDPPSPPAKPA